MDDINSDENCINWFMHLDIKRILGDCWPWQKYVLYYRLLITITIIILQKQIISYNY